MPTSLARAPAGVLVRGRKGFASAQPEPFLRARVHHHELFPAYTGLCVGYEQTVWRAEQLAEHLLEWLPEFALSNRELDALGHHNAVRLLRKAAHIVYQTPKYQNRGEFGELLLHAAVRQFCGSLPVISKIFFKSAANETVKGFDAVHVVEKGSELELWLGETKFYKDYRKAVRDVAKELVDHTRADYLRTEFALIQNKVDSEWVHAAAVNELLSPNTSLDSVFSRLRIPVLLTYESKCVGGYSVCNAEYEQAFVSEMEANYATFVGADWPKEIHVHLFLLPLDRKKALIDALHERLRAWQNI